MKVLCLLLSFGFCLNNASEFRTIVQSTHRRWGGCRIFDIMLIGPIRILLIIGLDSVCASESLFRGSKQNCADIEHIIFWLRGSNYRFDRLKDDLKQNWLLYGSHYITLF
ncbi:hypothetical protein YC2023_117655 [Brassica napus]